MSQIFQNTGTYDFGQGFRQEELENYYIDYAATGNKEHLVIVFEGSIVPSEEPPQSRYHWGGQLMHSLDISVIGVKNKNPDWYRGEELHLFFLSEAFQEIVGQYKDVYLYGNSMGGYAALAFAEALPGCTVLAYAPQSTLDPRIVPWDTRFELAQGRNWDGHFADAAKTLDQVKKAYVVYDPLFPPDKAHIDRLPADKIVHLKAPFMGHDAVIKFSGMELLKPIFMHLLDGDLESWFPKAMRVRKEYADYHVNALFLLTLRQHARGESEKAKQALERILTLFPGNPGALTLMQAIDEGRELTLTGFHGG